MSPELAVLKEFSLRGYLPWDYISRRAPIKSPHLMLHGVVVSEAEFRDILRSLTGKKLIKRGRAKNTFSATYFFQRSLTIYSLTDQGERLLKELGL